MITKVNITLGGTGYQFEFDEQSEMLAFHKAIAVSNYPTYCNLCQEEADKSTLKLTTSRDKEGNTYVNLKHDVCEGRVKLGQYKQGGYFWHRSFEKYVPKNNTQNDDETPQ